MIAPSSAEATSQGRRVLVAAVGIEWIVGFFGGPVVGNAFMLLLYVAPITLLTPNVSLSNLTADNTPSCMLQSALARPDLSEDDEDIPTTI
jgi:hypothetical protein